MNKKWQIVLAGSGGQGIGLAGQIFAETAGFCRGLNTVHNQSYGARARGGFSQSTVIISAEEIIYPFVEEPNLVITLNQKGYDLNFPVLSPDGLLLYELSTVNPKKDPRERGFPFLKTAQQMGHPLGVTLMALGTAARLTEMTSRTAMQKTMHKYFSGRTLTLNINAFDLGWKLAEG